MDRSDSSAGVKFYDEEHEFLKHIEYFVTSCATIIRSGEQFYKHSRGMTADLEKLISLRDELFYETGGVNRAATLNVLQQIRTIKERVSKNLG